MAVVGRWCSTALLVLAACTSPAPTGPVVLNDVSRLNATRVHEVIRVTDESHVLSALAKAREEGLAVSIAGRRHSQGAHAFARDAIVLDMTGFNRVLALDPAGRSVRVQSGATWHDVQDAADAHGLAVEVMQSSNIFTIGGSLSVNAHGRDPNFGPIVETVRSFRLARPDGSVVTVSRMENADLFQLVIGGFGLFGVILDVELSLTENAALHKRTELLGYREYPAWFEQNVRGHAEIGLHYARLSNVQGTFLREMYATSFVRGEPPADDRAAVMKLEDNEPVVVPRFFFGLARRWEWGKRLSWWLQKEIVDPPGEGGWLSRNNAMRPAVAFLQYDSDEDTDILQEYFVPTQRFVEFVDGMRGIFEKNEVNLLNLTVRFVRENHEALLSYARHDSFALVIYVNQGLSPDEVERARSWTQALVELALSLDGSYYLPYQRYPTPDEMRRTYPATARFFCLKRRHDPEERFTSGFYRYYAAPEQDVCN